jgi:glyoxylase-like metal-dependent hydrolase (beta-lactamase superfamily II)
MLFRATGILRRVHEAIPHWWSNLQVTAYAVPGHTEGSAAYLTNSVLFVGDPSVIFSTDRTQGEVSLRHLGQELEPHAAEVRFIATGHTGTVAGLEPLLSFGGS